MNNQVTPARCLKARISNPRQYFSICSPILHQVSLDACSLRTKPRQGAIFDIFHCRIAATKTTLAEIGLEQIRTPFVVHVADDLPAGNNRFDFRASGVDRPASTLRRNGNLFVMGITCPCCGLRFIVCAAHLTPDGRTVLCLNCETRWPMPIAGMATTQSIIPETLTVPVASPSGGQ